MFVLYKYGLNANKYITFVNTMFKLLLNTNYNDA